METRLLKPVAMALLLGSANLAQPVSAQSYLKGDFHQHTTYTDGSYTIGHMMSKNNNFGLDWWANSEHGGGFTTNARVTGKDNNNTIEYWDGYMPNPIIGTSAMSGGHQVMWRWQMLRDSSFTEILKARLLYPVKTILQSYEMNVPGHEHGSMGLITNQFTATPNCNPIAQFEFMFDNSDADLTGGVAQGWTKSTLFGHAKTLEALTWLKTNYPTTSYLVPAHPERKQQASGGYTIAAFRDMNNAAPTVCFGFESMPGHQKDGGRGGYGSSAVGGGTYGGTGYFSAIIGGLWDALLSEGRNFWLFANSDCHDEAGDFYPGEYQKNYTYTTGKTAQNIVDGLRSGNNWVVEGDLIDSLIYNVETIGTEKVTGVMGSSMVIAKGKSVKITIKARDPQAANYNTYSSYTNPVLNHIDIIKGKVTGKIDPASPKYSEQTVSTTSVIARFDAAGGVSDTKNITSQKWKSLGNGWVEMSMIISNITDSVYFRLRGTNQGLNVTNETDAEGNPLADALMGTNNATKAFADLWFYSNPIFVNTTPVKVAKFQIKQASDDLEEALTPEAGYTQSLPVGQIDWTSSDLELGCEGSANDVPQMVGLRFQGINLPKNITINHAYLEMEVDNASSKVDPCNLIIKSEDNDNPVTFTNTASVLTSRPKSTTSVAWNVDANSLNVVDQRYYSADIANLVQANLNRTGWNLGNAMAFYITGSGRREMESYDGEASAAATLVIEYSMNDSDIREMQIADSIAYKIALKSDSILALTSTLVESNYTIPSWTNFLMAKNAVITAPTDQSITGLDLAIDELIPSSQPFNISLTYNGSPTSKIGITWFTNGGVNNQMVEVYEGIISTPTGAPKQKIPGAIPVVNALVSTTSAATASLTNLNYNVSSNSLSSLAGIGTNSKKTYKSNKVLISDLNPNTIYSYRVGTPGAWSNYGTFTTAKSNKEPFSFVYFTDPQANTVEMFDISQKTTHAANTMYPSANFWLTCGDLVETSGTTNSEWEWERFFQTQQDIFTKKPLVAVTGNHDKSVNKNFTNHFNTESVAFDQAKSTTPGSIYSFVYGDALFMALSYEDYSVAGQLDSIANWMRRTVAANPNTKWRIAFYHKTMYTGSGSHQSDSDGKIIREAMAPVFDELKIDLALQGHDHIYEVMGPIKGKALVANSVKNQIAVAFDARENVTGKMGGVFNVLNGTLYFLNNSAGKKKYEPRSQAQMEAVESGLGLTNYFGMFSGRFAQTGRPTFSNIYVSTDTIEVKTYEVSDLGVASPFDSFKVVKTNDFTTSVNNTFAKGQNAVSVYPVPVKEYAYITFRENVNAKVEVYSTNGILVKSESINGSTQIDLSKLSKGNYIMNVVSGENNYSVKFIKE